MNVRRLQTSVDPRRAAGGLSLLAALAHGGLTASHFQQWWGYGAFFLATTLCQVILGLALLMDAFEDPKDQRRIAWGGIAGTSLVIAMYLVSRTLGIPFFGPAAGDVEPFEWIGLATLAAEVATVALLLIWLSKRGPSRPAPALRRAPSGR